MNWGADRKVMLRIYRSHIRTKLDYGSSINSATRKSYLEKLQTVHNQGLRLSLGTFRTSPMQSLYIEANELPLTLRWEKLSLQYTLKLQSSPNNPTHQKTNNFQFNQFYNSNLSAIPPFGFRIKEAKQQINQNANNISLLTMSSLPPWTINKPHIDLTLKQQEKPNQKYLPKTNSMNLETSIQTIQPFTPTGQKPWMEQEHQPLI